jgi:tetraacyldisaccharide 4'-kinase
MNNILYKNTFLNFLFIPFSYIYLFIVFIRRKLYQKNILKKAKFPVPVVIIGNITTGGSGKTPFIIWLANFLQDNGLFPGIVSRGYGSKAKHYPRIVKPDSNPLLDGDEPVLISRSTHLPMVVDPDRVQAVRTLLDKYYCNIVLSDDGLQHYALDRDLEIVLVDGSRNFGNGYGLPAGPLREPITRLQEAQFVLYKDDTKVDENHFCLKPSDFHSVLDKDSTKSIEDFKNKKIHAIAGIANPDLFFNLLRELGLTFIAHPFKDHHIFTAEEINFDADYILMTEKDAVKCEKFADNRYWYLPVAAQVNDNLAENILTVINELIAKSIP